jgi:radical SAM protein with 4Fe4S-binding SPASM domain
MVFGDATRVSLADVWAGNPVLREIRKGLPRSLKGVCGDCVVKNLCLGSCIAQNYYRSRDLWAPFWYCEEAKRLGLFPDSRLARRVPKSGPPHAISPSRNDELPNCHALRGNAL